MDYVDRLIRVLPISNETFFEAYYFLRVQIIKFPEINKGSTYYRELVAVAESFKNSGDHRVVREALVNLEHYLAYEKSILEMGPEFIKDERKRE